MKSRLVFTITLVMLLLGVLPVSTVSAGSTKLVRLTLVNKSEFDMEDN